MRELTQISVYLLPYNYLDAIIREEYGRPDYNVVEAEEWSNDTEHYGHVSPDDLDELDRDDLAHFRAGAPGCVVSWATLLSDLAERDIVPDGWYLITVMW
jgi:hypothetical protein